MGNAASIQTWVSLNSNPDNTKLANHLRLANVMQEGEDLK